MDLKLEQRVNIKFCVKLGKSETFEKSQQAYGNEARSWTRSSEWHSCFTWGRMSLEDNKRARRHSKSKTPQNVEEKDCWITIKKVADIVNLPYGKVQAILTSDLNMYHVAVKFVSRVQTPEQKQDHVEACEGLLV